MLLSARRAVAVSAHYLAWTTALLSTITSLVLSEVFHLLPCVLCWYQRILMYPLVFILAVGILRRDRRVYMYVLPLSVLGAVIALYHTLLQWGIIPDSVAPCRAGISCTTKQIDLFGFMTVPFGSLLAFTAISVLMIIYARSQHESRS
jgi:disulfide bond formation protein DsbB